MESSSRLYSQVAAQANVAPEVAMVACYLADLSRAGKTLDQAAALMRKDRVDVRNVARDWGLSFSDYQPGRKVMRLQWVKVKRGEWELRDGEKVVATANSDGEGRYAAGMMIDGKPVHHDGSSAEIAAKRLSIEIDRRSASLFGVDDVEIVFEPTAAKLAPVIKGNPAKQRQALAA